MPQCPGGISWSSFQINNNGMRLTLEIMDAAGVLRHVAVPELVSPPPPGFGPHSAPQHVYTYGSVELQSVDLMAGDPELARAIEAMNDSYLEENEAILARETLSEGRIDSHKWQTNDGWLVTDAECRAIASSLRAAFEILIPRFASTLGTAAEARRWLEQWIVFHELGAEHGGYRVY